MNSKSLETIRDNHLQIRKVASAVYQALNAGKLQVNPKTQEFIQDVWGQLLTSGCISPRQWDWLQDIYNTHLNRSEIVLPGNFHSTVAMLMLAHGGLKFPKMIFTINTMGDRIALIWNEEKGRASFTNGYARSNWAKHVTYGFLARDGVLSVKGNVPDRPEWREVLFFLSILSEDPVQAAKTSAAITGRCVYCDSELTDQRSKSVGYGPVCAEHYELPWGDKTNERLLPQDLSDLFTSMSGV